MASLRWWPAGAYPPPVMIINPARTWPAGAAPPTTQLANAVPPAPVTTCSTSTTANSPQESTLVHDVSLSTDVIVDQPQRDLTTSSPRHCVQFLGHAPVPVDDIPLRQPVKVSGLVAASSLNGTVGILSRWVEERNRFAVLLPDNTYKLIKPENLTDPTEEELDIFYAWDNNDDDMPFS